MICRQRMLQARLADNRCYKTEKLPTTDITRQIICRQQMLQDVRSADNRCYKTGIADNRCYKTENLKTN